jgi:GTP cyclohydrolase I
MEFDYFIKKKAPVSGFEGTMPYKCRFEASLNNILENGTSDYDFILTVEVPVTTLCPCSKEISKASAHNQRGYVNVSLRYSEIVWIEDVIEMVEAVSSCELYPILKRVDEKYVTEKAYENPRFVEDMVRMAAERLYEDERVNWFRVSSRHQESIHPHDAYASFEKWKKKKAL